MKKLMFGIGAALLTGAVMADVTSANIVGYSQNQLRQGATMLTPQFFAMEEGGMDIQALKPVGDSIDTEGGIYIQVLNRSGGEDEFYQWIDWGGDETGWMDGDYAIVTDKKFVEGAGLWVTGVSAADNIQSAGQVGQADVTVALRVGATGCGNPFPVPMDLQSIYLTADEGVDIDTEGGIYIQVLNRSGGEDEFYQWIDWGGDETGWMDGDYAIVTGKEFAPGAGLWVTGADGVYINFPAPEL